LCVLSASLRDRNQLTLLDSLSRRGAAENEA
jgi:hypothetical protein